MVSLLGAFGVGSLGYLNSVASRVRDQWLPGIGVLADLNNVTSDFRAAEGALLLAGDASQRAVAQTQIEELDHSVHSAQQHFLEIPRDSGQQALFSEFSADWNQYRSLVAQVSTLLQQGDRSSAISLYAGDSKAAYDAASDTLDLLTSRSIADARQASAREETTYRHARWSIAAVILLTCLSVTAAMTYVRRAISTPLLSLTRTMHRLAANETAVHIDATAREDEIGEMARAVLVFRGNAIELMNSQIGLEQQATMLREKLAEEQRLMLLQRNFVSMVSHDFRTPITIIDGHAQMLQASRDITAGTVSADRVRKIRNSARRLTHLIENLIDSMRVIDDDVRLYFHPSRLDVAALLREACQLQRDISPQAQILESLRPPILHLHADPHLLFQLLGNLLSNAIKYSPSGGLINVRLTTTATSAVIEVQDRGIGIPAADQPRLFDRYYRGSNTGGITGTGIGLYFVRTVSDLHGGQVYVTSHEGQGSSFIVQLPLGADLKQIVVSDALMPA
jgi:two-component system OmpR family sensor kinase